MPFSLMFLSFVLVVFQYLLHLTVETCIQLGSENLDAQFCCNGSLSKLRLSPLSETEVVIIDERYSSFQCFDRTNQVQSNKKFMILDDILLVASHCQVYIIRVMIESSLFKSLLH